MQKTKINIRIQKKTRIATQITHLLAPHRKLNMQEYILHYSIRTSWTIMLHHKKDQMHEQIDKTRAQLKIQKHT